MVKYKWSIYEWLRSSSQVIYYLVSAVRRKLDRVFLQGVHVETRHGHCWHEVGIGQHLMFLQKKVHKTAKLKTAIKKSLSANWKKCLDSKRLSFMLVGVRISLSQTTRAGKNRQGILTSCLNTCSNLVDPTSILTPSAELIKARLLASLKKISDEGSPIPKYLFWSYL